jgi:hypothetical protein
MIATHECVEMYCKLPRAIAGRISLRICCDERHHLMLQRARFATRPRPPHFTPLNTSNRHATHPPAAAHEHPYFLGHPKNSQQQRSAAHSAERAPPSRPPTAAHRPHPPPPHTHPKARRTRAGTFSATFSNLSRSHRPDNMKGFNQVLCNSLA